MLDGQTAIVTGASRGIGRAIAQRLGELGATVAATATSESGAQKAEQALRESGIEAKGYALDVTETESIEPFIKSVQDDLGNPGILVNNAGITRDGLLMRMKDEDWEDVIDTNLSSVFRLTRAVARPMMKAKGGRIINIASVVAAMGNAGQVNYSAAKAGILGLTKSSARELGPRGITVNAVAPGFIETDMTRELPEEQREALLQQIPLARLGDPAEVAECVAFLAGPGGGYVTGSTLHVNGGMYMG
ncbi:3-ketoacyl-ACP reductase [Thiohalorhabdus denitrificans]|uniref:3-oxoacyl-[acyl-carrier-protein] reductase n=1 Tax=Thiohalorhabdus denitrificans TaxID=381306 RepID=A0A0N8PN00_9GAMM|nr:3-oxoacyl-ACP reductase FabG [Thiohalorhabdus denitrificans]KPV40141.1 3-ketoacyl-ACP reductase [Thiohalorhabdus denitrificans]SCY17475.1 3-oxoacyl-[acyl-carrier-protein] reductase [Thiohalorhabdus denitrificans]